MRLIRILGSIQWITDQDPDLVLDLEPPPDLGAGSCSFREWLSRCQQKIFFFANYLCNVGTFTTVFKDKKSLKSHKTVKIMELLNFLLVDGNKYGHRFRSWRPKTDSADLDPTRIRI
jgi:hypothetical protein